MANHSAACQGIRFSLHVAKILIAASTIFIFFSTHRDANAQSYCQKPSGSYVREYEYARSSSLRTLAQTVASGKDYLIISAAKPAAINMANNGSIIRAAQESFEANGLMETGEVKKLVDETAKEISKTSNSSPDEIRTLVKHIILEKLFNGKLPTDIDYTYIYSSKTRSLADISGGIANEKGVVIESRPSNTGSIFTINSNDKHPVKRLIDSLDLGAIVLHGVDSEVDFLDYIPDIVPIIRVGNKDILLVGNSEILPNSTELSKVLKEIKTFSQHSEKDITIVNLFPKSKKDATIWGFDQITAQQYADAGKAFSRQIQAKGLQEVAVVEMNKKTILQELNRATQSSKYIFLIAEADKEGAIRVPGSNEIISAKDISDITDISKIHFISCNSNKISSGEAAISFSGRVYTDKASLILNLLLPNTEVEKSIDDVVMRLGESTPIFNIMSDISRLSCVASPNSNCSYTITRISNSEVENKRIVSMNPSLAIFLAALVGGLSREAFRWRAIYVSGRIQKYSTPLYLGIAAAIVLLAGLVGLILAPLAPSGQPQIAAAFVIGAGLELVVRQAARLKMPTVPMGGGERVQTMPSVSEFLRI